MADGTGYARGNCLVVTIIHTLPPRGTHLPYNLHMTDCTLLLGDCIEMLRGIPDNSIDACVTDPPYHLTAMTKRFGAPGAAPAKGPAFQRHNAGFMGKAWDGGDIAFQPETWAEVLRVLKPGGHLLSFGGTRTYHRMACAIEDAGFEVRDMIQWLYGCLSDDTEVLTRHGWIHHEAIEDTDEVLQWEQSIGSLTWVHPTAVHRYPYDGPMMRLANRHTDQLLTPNHRVYATVRRHSRPGTPSDVGTWEAQELRPCWITDLPMAGQLDGDMDGPDPEIAYLVGWWMTDAWAHQDGKAVMFSQCKPTTLTKLRAALAPHTPSEYIKRGRLPQHANEHTFYVTGSLASYLLTDHPNRRLTWSMVSWPLAARHALLEGLLDGDGSRPVNQYAEAFWSQGQERRDIVMALCVSLGIRCHEDPDKGVVYMNRQRSSTQLQKRHRDAAPDIPYSGTVWCLTVPAGAFVVRRNGRPFITGNSGFPKSHDVSKAIDKTRDDRIDVLAVTAAIAAARDASGFTNASIDAAFRRHGMAGHWTTQGAQPAVPTWHQWLRLREILSIDDVSLDSEVWRLNGRKGAPGEAWGFRPVIGERDVPIGHAFAGPTYGRDLSTKTIRDTTAHLGEAKTWQGWGTALKPANEPVVLARKPLAGKTVASNVVEYGTGALNIDGCRVEGAERPLLENAGRADPRGEGFNGKFGSAAVGVTLLGRWPANVIMDEEAGALLDEQSGERGGSGKSSGPTLTGVSQSVSRGQFNGVADTPFYGDTGGASRFFYSSKASTAERSAGLDNRNLHPTVKPISLMRYLVRLITPPGGMVLDPFMGSGTTGIAAQLEGMSFMGIEKEQEYMDIARARLSHWATKEKAS